MRHYGLYILPAVAAAILFEWAVFRVRAGKPYPWREGVVSLAIAVGHRLSQALGQVFFAGLFLLCWRHRLLTIPLSKPWGLLLLFVGVEFVYYWDHRLSHRVRWLWATHAVHHSPNELTLSSAYRLGWTGPLSGTGLLFLPLIFFGIPPLALATTLTLNLLYQFWLHTQLIPRLGWFDQVFNSPSNHRVHHASNPEYLDRNFGGVLIVFDRLFGTYAAERHDLPCRYGLVEPQRSSNPLVVALVEWSRLLRDARMARGPRALFKTLFGPPPARALQQADTTVPAIPNGEPG